MNSLRRLVAQLAEGCEIAVEQEHAALTGAIRALERRIARCESHMAAVERVARCVVMRDGPRDAPMAVRAASSESSHTERAPIADASTRGLVESQCTGRAAVARYIQ